MTDKEKQQFDELYSMIGDAHDCDRDLCRGKDCRACHATRILDAGYRKESEVVKDVLMEMYEYLQKECGYSKYDYEIRELVAFAEKYGVKLEVEE